MPDFSATTVSGGTRDGTEHVDAAFKTEQTKQGENQCFFVIDGLMIGDDDLMMGMALDTLDKITVVGTAASDKHLAFGQAIDCLGDLDGNMLGEGGQGIANRIRLQQRFLEGFKELPA